MADALLQLGSSGADVAALQRLLISNGANIAVSGKYDDPTIMAVGAAQQQAGMLATGIADQATWDLLRAGSAPGTAIAGMSKGALIFGAIAAAGVIYFLATRRKKKGSGISAWRGEPMPREVKGGFRMGRHMGDDVTDSLLDEPALVADTGRPGDCYKAAKLLSARRGLAKSGRERTLFRKVVKSVVDSCREQPESIERAVTEAADRIEEAESLFEAKGGAMKPHDVTKAVELWLELDPHAVRGEVERHIRADEEESESVHADPYDPASHRGTRRTEMERERRAIHAASKKKSGVKGGRPKTGASYVLKTKGGEKFRVRREPDKSRKTGYRMRRERL